jgi:hypothetical protein
VLHGTDCASNPVQSSPPSAGAGLSHSRLCVSWPPPHEALHSVPFTQSLQPPLTGQGCMAHVTVCVSNPVQSAPPLAGDGLSQVRFCVSWPSPHEAVHAVTFTQSLQPPSTMQDCVLHCAVCVSEPVQFAPPLEGGGLVHVRFCVSWPPPHVAVHVVTFTQSDQFPSTAGQTSRLHGTICVLLPSQSSPPSAGAGLVHVRICVSWPPPHGAVHAVVLNQSLQLPSTLQDCVLHATVWVSDPGQKSPPFVGGGLSHSRCWVSWPPPHVAVHVVAFTQSDHPPSGPGGRETDNKITPTE